MADGGFPDMEQYGIAVYTPITDHADPIWATFLFKGPKIGTSTFSFYWFVQV